MIVDCMIILPKKSQTIHWTNHSKMKMRHYRFSESRVLRILRKPDRVEEGIAPYTLAAMQKSGTKKHPTEAWLMYQIKKSKVTIISAWRFPGITPVGQRPQIPQDTLDEISKLQN